MKKVLPALVLTSFLAVLIMPMAALAVEEIPEPRVTTIEGLINLIDEVANYIFAFVLAIAVIFLLIAGFNFMTAAGDETKIKKARDFLTWALVGIAIAVGTKGLIAIIKNFLIG